MSTFELYRPVTVPSLDKGGVLVAISGDRCTVDFGYGETQDFLVSQVQPHGA
jgi:hypothetical protein